MNLVFSIHPPTIFITLIIVYIAMILGYIIGDFNYGDLHRLVKWFPKKQKISPSNNNKNKTLQNYYGNAF